MVAGPLDKLCLYPLLISVQPFYSQCSPIGPNYFTRFAFKHFKCKYEKCAVKEGTKRFVTYSSRLYSVGCGKIFALGKLRTIKALSAIPRF